MYIYAYDMYIYTYTTISLFNMRSCRVTITIIYVVNLSIFGIVLKCVPYYYTKYKHYYHYYKKNALL